MPAMLLLPLLLLLTLLRLPPLLAAATAGRREVGNSNPAAGATAVVTISNYRNDQNLLDDGIQRCATSGDCDPKFRVSIGTDVTGCRGDLLEAWSKAFNDAKRIPGSFFVANFTLPARTKDGLHVCVAVWDNELLGPDQLIARFSDRVPLPQLLRDRHWRRNRVSESSVSLTITIQLARSDTPTAVASAAAPSTKSELLITVPLIGACCLLLVLLVVSFSLCQLRKMEKPAVPHQCGQHATRNYRNPVYVGKRLRGWTRGSAAASQVTEGADTYETLEDRSQDVCATPASVP